ncbi:hypothetical protein BGV50_25265 [Burkholderia ubonensis]|nr:hypothetical protein BGV50_25265 [Burkholderia ubonensis]
MTVGNVSSLRQKLLPQNARAPVNGTLPSASSIASSVSSFLIRISVFGFDNSYSTTCCLMPKLSSRFATTRLPSASRITPRSAPSR